MRGAAWCGAQPNSIMKTTDPTRDDYVAWLAPIEGLDSDLRADADRRCEMYRTRLVLPIVRGLLPWTEADAASGDWKREAIEAAHVAVDACGAGVVALILECAQSPDNGPDLCGIHARQAETADTMMYYLAVGALVADVTDAARAEAAQYILPVVPPAKPIEPSAERYGRVIADIVERWTAEGPIDPLCRIGDDVGSQVPVRLIAEALGLDVVVGFGLGCPYPVRMIAAPGYMVMRGDGETAEVHEAADTAEAVRLCAGGDPELIGTVVQVYRAGWTLIGNALVRAETGKATMEVPQ